MSGDIAQCLVPFPEIKFGNGSQKHAKIDIKLFLSCPVFLDFSILLQIFCSGLQLLGDAVLVIQKLIVMSEKGGCRRHEIKTDIFNIPYSIFHILILKSVLVFFIFALTSFASVSLLTFHTSTILAPSQFTNFERCRFQNLSISTSSCLADSSCFAWSKVLNKN